MKNILLALMLGAFFLPASAQESQQLPKLSPLTQIYLKTVEAYAGKDGIVPGYVYKSYNATSYISALIQVGQGFNDEALKPAGVLIGTKAGNIWTAQVPVQNVLRFTQIPGLKYIQLDEPAMRLLDSARKYTHVDSVQSGIGMSAPFYGKGVVVGVVDAGFDFTNPVLWDTGGSYYRVKRIWSQKAATGTPPAGYIYGAQMTDSNAMWAAQTDQTSESHGSHVTGIAAGSGYGSTATSNLRYRGMAPLSDIVLVGIMPQQQNWIGTGGTDIIDGVHYVYQYAASVGKPAVVNLSWGASLGPHDASSLFNQAMDNMTGAGKIFVTSAGNSGDTKVHLKKTFTAVDSTVSTFPTFDATVKKTWVDIWGDTLKPFCVKVTLYNGSAAGNTTGLVCMDNQLHQFTLIGSNGDTCFLSITANASEFNSKPRTFISIYSKVPDSICVTVVAKAGTINMWNQYVEAPTGYIEPFTNGGKSWATAGDTLQSISDNAAANTAIAVGAYSSKTSWRTVGNVTYSYTSAVKGAIAPFSSTGPTEDGRMKPDIAGPGFGVASTVNSYDATYAPGSPGYTSAVVSSYTSPRDGRAYRYAVFAGTSMSSPAVSGIIALLLEAAPMLTPQQVKDIMNQTAIRDNFTGAAMDNTWGGGKINAYQALKRAMQTTGIGGVTKNDLACHLFPNPNNGNFTIGFLGEKPEQLSVAVYDAAGRCVLQSEWAVSNGYNTKSISVNNLAKGIYIARIATADGGASTLRMIVE